MESIEQSRFLLLGLLALQNGFVTREQLFAAFGAWLSDKSKSLADYLIDQKALKPEHLEIVFRIVDIHLESHENDLEKSLAGVNPSIDIREELQTLAMNFPEFEQSLAPLSVPTQKLANPDLERSGGNSADPTQSRQIGNYRLLQKLGEGGMGTVWMAEQEKPVRRRVAIKLIKAGIDNEQIIARFEAERQALSMMDHVNIARVLDAGTTESGQPYFVMELVQGIPITEYCDKHRMSLRDRLGLFIPVCQAVQHAHQKGIIHRDLKPSNVLITVYDGKPVPKVIDFGLAKALQHQTKLTDKTMFTEFGQVVGTLQYMSPEQAEMNTMDIDTRSDIYSLGVMLYELLTGSTPIEKESMRNEAILKVLQSIREVEPQRPSARLSGTTQEAVSGISEQRRIDPKKLQSILRGELDWIVMKSLEKDRGRRYATALDMADDIERHLNGDPIRARPPSVGYKLRKLVRKNRGLVALTVLASVLLGAGIVGTSWFTVEYRKVRQGQLITLVDALQNNLGSSFSANLTTLKETLPDSSVLPELQKRFDSATNPRHKLSLAYGLAHYGKSKANFLASRIEDIEQPDKHNYIAALRTDLSAALSSIRSEANHCGDKSLWQRKAKLAIVALNLGEIAIASDMCTFEDRPDPKQRTLFIDEFSRWNTQLVEIHDLVAEIDSPSLRSGLCLAVGQIDVNKLSDAEKEHWQRLASRWFVEKGDTATHSAAGWLLRSWGIAEPKPHDGDKIVPHRNWFVNSNGTTMFKVRSGFAFRDDKSKQLIEEFWVSDREVTRGQFETFMNDGSYPYKEKPETWEGVEQIVSPSMDHPVQKVSWYDAVKYCNWLSIREGRLPVYERIGTMEGNPNVSEQNAFREIAGSTGYRLLREAEWEYVCRAGAATDYSIGSDTSFLADYGQLYPSRTAAVCGYKKPNAWGFYDFHGNVWEWCMDTFDGASSLRVNRGGGYQSIATHCRSGFRGSYDPMLRTLDCGLRIALSPAFQQPEAEKENK
jgi:serine/threonine protein kinase/formylglycine-generating enzyme required for sulfatase activity